jgi:PPK2 family polyphosphate:nucleotide phosphotransferase
MDRFRVKPGKKISLADIDPQGTDGFEGDKDAGKARLMELNGELETLQELLYAESKHPVLIVLQGMDTSGKDGTIRHVFEGVNPQGVRVAGFGVPSEGEAAHDYLWRIHRQTPRRGEIVIFNRSHYEDVLVVRVHDLVPKTQWERRYDQINAFERMLVEEGTTIRKFFLHISPDEQKERLQERLDRPDKHWKFNPRDLKERKRWDEYTRAYEDVLMRTSTEHAPWYVIPANRKWFRNLAVATTLVETLQGLKMRLPKAEFNPEEITIR